MVLRFFFLAAGRTNLTESVGLLPMSEEKLGDRVCENEGIKGGEGTSDGENSWLGEFAPS